MNRCSSDRPFSRWLVETTAPFTCCVYRVVSSRETEGCCSSCFTNCVFFPGNFESKGPARQQELWRACKLLNIQDESITLVNSTQLLDDPNVSWKSQIIAKQILKQVDSLDIDVVITFDRDGVSGHANHSAIYYATASVFIAGLLPDGLCSSSVVVPFPHR